MVKTEKRKIVEEYYDGNTLIRVTEPVYTDPEDIQRVLQDLANVVYKSAERQAREKYEREHPVSAS